jgi:uncharacterized protein
MFDITLADRDGNHDHLLYDPLASRLIHADGSRPISLAAVGLAYDGLAQWPASTAVSAGKPGHKSRRPRQINIQLGLKCNYACSYCLQRFQPAHDEGRLADVERFLASLDDWFDGDATSRVEFKYWGGEPFLYWKKLRPLADALRDRFPQSRHVIVTNGSLLDAGKNAWLDALGAVVAISHDGPGQAQRGADPFEDPLKAAAILDLYDRLAPQGRISFNVVLTAQHHDLDAIHAWFAERLPGRPVHLSIENIVLPYHAEGMQSGLHDAAAQQALVQSLFRSMVAGEGRAFHTVRRKLDDFYRSLAEGRSAAALGQKCGMDRPDQIAVTLKGDVLTCHNVSPTARMEDGRSHRIGSTADLDAVALDTATHWSLRDKCRSCPVLQLCKGSCMYLEGEAFEAACANEFAYNMALMMAGLWSLTGKLPVAVDRVAV